MGKYRNNNSKVNIPHGTDFNNIPLEHPNNETKQSKVDLDRLLNESLIDPSEVMEAPQVAFQMKKGNDFMIIGKAKSRKTFLMILLLSASIMKAIFLNHIKGCLNEPQTVVLFFDTEQSRYHVQKTVKRICKLIGIEVPANFYAYGLRKFHPDKRLELIEHAIYQNDKIGVVGIDGIKDLISSINDEEQATMISSKLLKWTEERNIHLACVLHQNKGDINARGHLGSELVNKAETVLSVTISEENSEISIVKADYCRDKEPDSFAFEIDLDGLPQEAENRCMKTPEAKNKFSVNTMEPGKVYQLLKDSFSEKTEMGYSELVIQVKLSYEKQNTVSIGDNKTKEFITFCKNKKWIFQEKDKGPYSLKDFI